MNKRIDDLVPAPIDANTGKRLATESIDFGNKDVSAHRFFGDGSGLTNLPAATIDDSNLVHKTSDETINGRKYFKNQPEFQDTLLVRNPADQNTATQIAPFLISISNGNQNSIFSANDFHFSVNNQNVASVVYYNNKLTITSLVIEVSQAPTTALGVANKSYVDAAFKTPKRKFVKLTANASQNITEIGAIFFDHLIMCYTSNGQKYTKILTLYNSDYSQSSNTLTINSTAFNQVYPNGDIYLEYTYFS